MAWVDVSANFIVNNIHKVLFNSVKMPLFILFLIILITVSGTYFYCTFYSTYSIEHELRNYMEKYNKLGINLSTVGGFCNEDMLKKIPQAEVLINTIGALSSKLPKDNPYEIFFLDQIGAKRINSARLKTQHPMIRIRFDSYAEQCESVIAAKASTR